MAPHVEDTRHRLGRRIRGCLASGTAGNGDVRLGTRSRRRNHGARGQAGGTSGPGVRVHLRRRRRRGRAHARHGGWDRPAPLGPRARRRGDQGEPRAGAGRGGIGTMGARVLVQPRVRWRRQKPARVGLQ